MQFKINCFIHQQQQKTRVNGNDQFIDDKLIDRRKRIYLRCVNYIFSLFLKNKKESITR
jgi:hypothetical protein